MKLITRNTDYAIRALVFLAGSKDELVSASRLYANLKVPKPFIRGILQVLNKKGVLESCKGKGGGFKLAMAPKDILLIELMRIFQGELTLNECSFKRKPCPNKSRCALRKKISLIERFVLSQLGSISLESLLK